MDHRLTRKLSIVFVTFCFLLNESGFNCALGAESIKPYLKELAHNKYLKYLHPWILMPLEN
jgi:hypothetical protein